MKLNEKAIATFSIDGIILSRGFPVEF